MARLAGIDVGPTHVRIALVRTSYRRFAVEALAEAPIAEGGEEAAIRAAMGSLRPEGIAIALPGDRCFYRRLELPATAQKELENVVAFELESSIPFEMEGAVFDKRLLEAERDQLLVFAAIARIDDVQGRIDVVRAATGREPDVVDTGSITLANLVAVVPELAPPTVPGAPRQPVAVLDLGETRSELLVLVGGEPAFVRTVSRGTQGLPGSASVLGRELKQSLAAWRASGGAPPSALWLVGTGAGVVGAEPFLSSTLELPVQRLPGMRLEGASPEQQAQLPAFAKAVALALALDGKSRSLNLRQGPLEMARSFAFLREKLPILSGLAAVVLVSFGFSVVAELRALSAEKQVLEEELKTVTREVLGEETTDVARATELFEKGPAGEDDPLPQVDAFDVMVQLSRAVPKNVVHDVAELDVARGHAVIQGLVPDGADAQGAAEGIAATMREFGCFRDVKVQKTTKAGPEKQKYILELELRCEDKKDPKKAAKKGEADGAKKEGAEESL